MNKKGQTLFYGFMIFLMIIISVIAILDAFKGNIENARSADNLDCDNTSISVGSKGTCILVDFSMFYFVGTCFALGAAYLTGKAVGVF